MAWRNERWLLVALDMKLPVSLILRPVEHFDIADLPDDMAAEMGLLMVRVTAAVEELPSVGRCHIGRYGDGGAHAHPSSSAARPGWASCGGRACSTGRRTCPRCPRTYAAPTPATSGAAWSTGSAARARRGRRRPTPKDGSGTRRLVGGDHVVGRRPLPDVALLDRGGHQVGEQVGRAREGRHADLGERRGVVGVEGRRAGVAQREQGDHGRARADDGARPAEHLLGDAAFVQVADEDQHRVVGLADQALAVGQRPVDVGAAAELDAEEHVDRVVELVGQVDDLGVEDDQAACATDRIDASTAPKTLE